MIAEFISVISVVLRGKALSQKFLQVRTRPPVGAARSDLKGTSECQSSCTQMRSRNWN